MTTSSLDYSETSRSASPSPVEGTSVSPRWVWPLQRQIVATVVLAILLFGIALQLWNYKTLLGNEFQRTEEKHLVIAKNLSLSLSRYMNDVAKIFVFVARKMDEQPQYNLEPEFDILSSLNVVSVAILAPDSSNVTRWLGPAKTVPSADIIKQLQTGTNQSLGGVQVSGIVLLDGIRYFLLGYNLPDGRTVVGYLDPKYIKEVQSAISFGELGHSAIFDHFGRTVAHPLKKAETEMIDMSQLSAVKRMLNGETGVDLFFSPAMKLDMVAGISFVPETKWPVMVPQPTRELEATVNSSLSQSYLLASLMAIILGIVGWYLARRIVKPVRQFTAVSNELARGDYNVTLPQTERSSLEMWQLNESLKRMVSRIADSDLRLRDALKVEKENSKKKDDFLVVAGHELRTPLNGITGMLSVCEEGTTDPDLKENLAVTRKSADQLRTLLNDMIDYADGTSKETSLDASTFNLGREMHDLARLFKRQATEAGLEFHLENVGKSDGDIVTDRVRLVQATSKLLENAVKFTSLGHISLSYELSAPDTDGHAELKVSVKDTGIGIDESNIEHIFAPFSQVDSSYSRRHAGLGIGLAIAKSFTDKLGGQIECSSKRDEGSTFTIRIPVVRA